MKRSYNAGPSSNGATHSAKRQVSLAAFLKPSPKNTIERPLATPSPAKKVKSESHPHTETPDGGKVVVLSGSDDTLVVDKGKGKVASATSEVYPELDLGQPWPSEGHPYHPPPTSTYNHPIVLPPVPPTLQSIQYHLAPRIIRNPTTDLDLVYYRQFVDGPSSGALFKYLLHELPWYRVKYTVRGININTPRYTTVFGKDATEIPWTGYMKCKPRAIPDVLVRLMRKVEQVTSSTYNFCLVNYYSSGADSISFHSDSESFLGPEPSIASLSLAHSRDFHLRHIHHKNHPRTSGPVAVEKFVLQDGDMVLMKGRTQHEWEHSIPKRKTAGGRINITFRKGVVRYATENYYNYNVGKGEMYRWDGGRKEMAQVDQ